MGSVVLMAESAANVSPVSGPKNQASPPGFVLALAHSSRRVWEALQVLSHTDRSIPPPAGAAQGHCPAEWWCFDLVLLLQLLPSGLLWWLSCDWRCVRGFACVNESTGDICASPRWMLPGKGHLQMALACWNTTDLYCSLQPTSLLNAESIHEMSPNAPQLVSV